MLLLEIRSRDDGHVAEDQELVVVRILDHGHVAQNGLGRQQAALLVEDAAHVFVGAAKAFHQDVAFAVADHAHGLGDRFELVLVVDDVEDGRVDLLVLADFQDLVLVADEGDLDDAFLDGLGSGGDGVVVHAPGGNHAFLAPGAEFFK